MGRKMVMIIVTGLLMVHLPLGADDAQAVHRLTANVTLTSEYICRGIAQTNHQPAIQGGFDYKHRSGFYLGNWNSNSSWIADSALDAHLSLEVNFYGGFRGQMGDWGYDLGGLYFFFPGQYGTAWTEVYNRPGTFELYAAVNYRWFTLKYSHALTDMLGNRDSSGSNYLEFNAAVNVTGALVLSGHVAHQTIRNLPVGDYSDWKLGLSYDLGVVEVGLAYAGSNADVAFYSTPLNPDLGKGRLLVSLSKTL